MICLLALALGGSQVHGQPGGLRVPAEWEPHSGTWMQWPDFYERGLRAPFAEIIRAVQAHEPVRLLTRDEKEREAARAFLTKRKIPLKNIELHVVPFDNAWLRDNGPIYVTDGRRTWIQNWKFDAWGGNFGRSVGWRQDNEVPKFIGKVLGLRVEDKTDYVLERGNVEFNGAGVLVINWDCQQDRNPGLTKAEHETILRRAFGVTKIIWAYGYDPRDKTTGHIDGIARFIDRDTLVVTEFGTRTEVDLIVAARAAGLNVKRYPGDPNWLVGNGFVVGMGENDRKYDARMKAVLQGFFPGRKVYMVDARKIMRSGGGVHCVTNDAPALP
jgi:agmatine deiminase